MSRVWRKVKTSGTRGTPARLPKNRSCGTFSTAQWCGCGSTAKRLLSRSLSSLACARTARRCCSRSRHGRRGTEAWRTVLDDLIKRGLRPPEFLIVDGAPGLDKAIAVVWDGVPVQRCTVHKHRNLLAHAPERLHEEITADYTDMIYAATRQQIEARRKAFIRKWRLEHRAVADSLEEAGDRLFTFARLPPSQWRSARTTNAIERLHEEFKRRIKTQTVLPSADTAAMLFWALLPPARSTCAR